jgi:hypothetical protein
MFAVGAVFNIFQRFKKLFEDGKHTFHPLQVLHFFLQTSFRLQAEIIESLLKFYLFPIRFWKMPHNKKIFFRIGLHCPRQICLGLFNPKLHPNRMKNDCRKCRLGKQSSRALHSLRI